MTLRIWMAAGLLLCALDLTAATAKKKTTSQIDEGHRFGGEDEDGNGAWQAREAPGEEGGGASLYATGAGAGAL